MTAVLNRPDEGILKPALLSIAAWQKAITDNPYNPGAGEQRLRSQQRLAKAALTSADETIAVILDQAAGQIPETALDYVPTVDYGIMAHEIVNPNWQSDSALHSSLSATGCSRSETMELGWWHLLTLRLLSERRLPDPPAYLLDLAAPASLPFNRASLTASDNEITPEERKRVDRSIRNLIRHSGGIWHRRGRWLFDAPLAAAWWRVEMSRAASDAYQDSISPEGAYGAFRAAWRVWADAAARNSTRLATPNCAAAFVLAAFSHRDSTGALPTGSAAKRMVAKLMRRTQHLSVGHIDPLELSELAL